MITLKAVCGVCVFISSFTQPEHDVPPGWGVIVNRTQREQVLDLTDSAGQTSARSLPPGAALPLFYSDRYVVRIRESGTPVTVTAAALAMRITDGKSSRAPEWSLANPQKKSFRDTYRSIWGLRHYQIVDIQGKPELRTGFSRNDIDNCIARYRKDITDFGFALREGVVYPRLHPERVLQKNDESSEEVFGTTARQLQEKALRDAIGDFIVLDSTPFLNRVQSYKPTNVIDFAVYYKSQEFGLVSSPNSDQVIGAPQLDGVRVPSGIQAVVSILGTSISPEVQSFVRAVSAGALGVPEDSVVVWCNFQFPAAAASPPRPILKALSGDQTKVSQLVMNEVTNVIQKDEFVRTLQLPAFTSSISKKSWFGVEHEGYEYSAVSQWRYHRLSDNVRFMDAIPAMKGMDLRWGFAITYWISDLGKDQPHMSVQVALVVETKRAAENRSKYKRWSTNVSQFWIEPLGTTIKEIDLEGKTLQLQWAICEACLE